LYLLQNIAQIKRKKVFPKHILFRGVETVCKDKKYAMEEDQFHLRNNNKMVFDFFLKDVISLVQQSSFS